MVFELSIVFFSFILATIYIFKNKFTRTVKELINKERPLKVEGVLNIIEVLSNIKKIVKNDLLYISLFIYFSFSLILYFSNLNL